MKIFENSTLHGTLGINFFRKNHHKTRLDTFGNTFGHFWNFENIFFRKFLKTRHSMENWAKIFQKIFPKTCSKHVWILLGTLLGIFGILKIFFLKIFENSTRRGKLGKKFSKSLPQNTFKTRLDTFGNDFGHFWNFEKKNFENFRKLVPPWNTGHNFFSKKSP